MSVAFLQEESIRWSDVDAMGVVNNAVYLTLFEQARYGYFRALACLTGDWFPFVLGATAVRFLRPGRAGMRVVVGARVTRLGHKSFDMSYSVTCGEDELATGTATLVWVAADLTSAPIPDDVRATIAAREGIPSRG
ncbi:MAG: thioesterase family protein [Planctomycetota bacterium]